MRIPRGLGTYASIGLILLVAWQQVQLVQHQRALARLANQHLTLVEALEAIEQQRTKLPVVRTPMPSELFQRPNSRPPNVQGDEPSVAPRPQRAGGTRTGAAARRFMQQRAAFMAAREGSGNAPGAQVLDRLYDAADRMAMEESWDDQTYDDVTVVFEDTTDAMADLWGEFRAGELAPLDARDEAFAIRDDAEDRLAAILGEDGLVALRDHMRATKGDPR